MRKAIYALSGDPLTVGHSNLIERAARLFDELVVAIGNNPAKSYAFSLSERQAMARASLAHLPNVAVTTFDGLLVDYAYKIGAKVLVRGVRTQEDMEYERNLFWLGDTQQQGLETVVLLAKQELAHISSSAVKEIQAAQGLVHEYVSLPVKQQLEQRISGQFLVGVTGEIAVGKNYVSEQLVALAKNQGFPAHHIDLDALGHEILAQTKPTGFHQVQQQIIAEFGPQVVTDAVIDRTKLAKLVFADVLALQKLNQLMARPLLMQLRQALFGKRGLIVINGALLTEFSWLPLVNNRVIVVSAPAAIQQQWLHQRGLGAAAAAARLKAQATTAQKTQAVAAAITQAQFGQLFELKNQPNTDLVTLLTSQLQPIWVHLAKLVKKESL